MKKVILYVFMAVMVMSCAKEDEIEIVSSISQNEFDDIIGKIELRNLGMPSEPQVENLWYTIYTRFPKSKQQVDSILSSYFGGFASFTLDNIELRYGSNPDNLINSVDIGENIGGIQRYDNEWHEISLVEENNEEDCFIQIRAYGTLILKNCYNYINNNLDFDEYYEYRYGGWFQMSSEIHQVLSKNIKEPEAIDLGLSVKWASCNLGGLAPCDAGIMAVWGDPTGTVLENADYEYCGGKNVPYNISGTELDIAKAMLGGNWRLPTAEEVQELKDKCKRESFKSELYDINRQTQYNYIGPNGNSITFLEGVLDSDYMTGSLSEIVSDKILRITYFNLETGNLGKSSANNLYYIRPVLDE